MSEESGVAARDGAALKVGRSSDFREGEGGSGVGGLLYKGGNSVDAVCRGSWLCDRLVWSRRVVGVTSSASLPLSDSSDEKYSAPTSFLSRAEAGTEEGLFEGGGRAFATVGDCEEMGRPGAIS